MTATDADAEIDGLAMAAETPHKTPPADDEGATAADAEREKRDDDANGGGNTWLRVAAFVVLPGIALLGAIAAGFLKWQDSLISDAEAARTESVRAATDGAIALLSYRPETVDKDLDAARSRMTGTFKESYTQLTRDVVVPGAKQKHISAVASVPAATSVSASPTHAVALLFVNQTVIIGQDAPTNTASSVRVTLDIVGDQWLISGFDPV